MLSSSFDVMICKKEGLQLESYDHLRNFRHANAIPLLDYYIQEGKFGRLIVPKMHLSFQSWFERGGRSLLFDEMGHMTPVFEKLIMWVLLHQHVFSFHALHKTYMCLCIHMQRILWSHRKFAYAEFDPWKFWYKKHVCEYLWWGADAVCFVNKRY